MYRVNKGILSRRHGGSAVKAGGYRHAMTVTNELTGEVKSYEGKKRELVHEAILLPENAPDWAVERYSGADVGKASERLWNDIERREDQHNYRKVAQLAASYTISIPRELSREAQIRIVETFARENLMKHGEIVDIVIHDKGDGNPHAHIMTTLRGLENDGFGKRIMAFNSKRIELLQERMAWACVANAALEAEGYDTRIDHRSNVDRGLELVPGTTYSHEIAANIEKDGGVYRAKTRAKEARAENERILSEKPEHILLVLTQEKPLFVMEDIVFELGRKLPADVGMDAVNELAHRVMASPEMVAIGEVDRSGAPIYTTRTALEISRQLTRSTLQMRDSELDLGQADPSPVLDSSLFEEQRNAVEAMISAQRITVVEGYAGAGKTYALEKASEIWADRGFAVYGSAVSGKAVQELAGLEGHAGTIAHFEQMWDAGGLPPQGKFVMFMDEASMVGTAVWSRFQERVNAMGGKIIVAGDRAQMPPVNDTSALGHVVSLTGVTAITEVVRQKDERDRAAIQILSQGVEGVGPALRHFAEQGYVRISDRAADAKAKIVEGYFEGTTPEQYWKVNGHQRIAIAHTNADVDDLNTKLQARAMELGFVSTEAEDSLTISRRRDGKTPIQIRVGDRVRFTRPSSEAGVSRSSLGTVLSIRGSDIILDVDGHGEPKRIDTTKMDDFDLGYAITVHKSQGMTVKGKPFVLLSGLYDWHLTDVAFSRFADEMEIHIAALDFVPDPSKVSPEALLEAVITRVSHSGLQKVVDANVAPTLRRAHPTLEDVLSGARADRMVSATAGQDGIELVRVSVETDVHIFQTSQRIAGLLRGEFKEGDPIFGLDPRGYAIDPKKVVDDLLAERGVVRAGDIAARLAEVVREPSTFIRLYYDAMSHPDLIVLSEHGIAGEGRVYSTVGQVAQATSAMDQALRLAVRQENFDVGSFVPSQLEVPPASLQLDKLSADFFVIERVSGDHAIVTGQSSIRSDGQVLTGGGVHPAPQIDWAAMRKEALAAKIRDITASRGFDADQGNALSHVLWPSRIGILDSVGSEASTSIVQGAKDVLGDDRITVIHPSRSVGSSAARSIGCPAHTLHSFGAEIKAGTLTVGAGDILYVPEASNLSLDQIKTIMDHSERLGAKVVLHRDPSLEGPGAVLRHLADRLPVAHVDGLGKVTPVLRDLIKGGDGLKESVAALWQDGSLIGASSEKLQVSGFVQAYLERGVYDTVGLATTVQMRDTLNKDIEAARRKADAETSSPSFSLDRGSYSTPLDVSIGTRLVVTRDMADHKLVAGQFGRVLGHSDDGRLLLRFEDMYPSDVLIAPGAAAASLDYGYVVSPKMATSIDVADRDVMLFGTRSLRTRDLTLAVRSSANLTFSLPVDVDLEGAAADYFTNVHARAPRGTVLDYGFDPSKALRAAGEAYKAPDLVEQLEVSADNRAVLDATVAAYRANPEFILSDLTRQHGRFTVVELALELGKYYPDTELEMQDRVQMALDLTQRFEADGTLIDVGLSDEDGLQRYTTRVQAEIEMKAVEVGRGLAATSLQETFTPITSDLRLDHVTGGERLSLAIVPQGAEAQQAFYHNLGQVWRDRGYHIIAADMGKASAEAHAALLGDGTEFASWTALDARWSMGRVPVDGKKTVLVLSGAETMPSAQWARIQDRADKMGLKVIALAGQHDLPRNNSLSLFKVLSAEIGVYADTPSLVQTREADRMAATLLSGTSEDAARAIAIHDGLGHVHFSGARDSAVQAIARRYWKDGAATDVSRLALAHSHKNASSLDQAIRQEGVRLGHLGETVDIGAWTANIGQQLYVAASISPQMSKGAFVQLIGVDEDHIQVRTLGGTTTHLIPHDALGHVKPALAQTLWNATSIEMDKSFVLATYGMDQSLFRVAASRHRNDIEIHAANRDFRDIAALQRAAGQRHDLEALKQGLEAQVRQLVDDPTLLARRDRTKPMLVAGDYAKDAHLQSIAQRAGDLLALGYDPRNPIVVDDPNGYATDPRKVVDDILSNSSVLRAEDVALRLSSVVRDPKTFERLFAEAMSHPDLVILTEEGRNGEGRVYSTRAQIKLEIEVSDRVTALSMTPNGFVASDTLINRASHTVHGPMTADQVRALHHATSGARVAVIRGGAGSGKSTLLSGVRSVYEAQGWSVYGAAHSNDAKRTLEEASGIKSRTLYSLLKAYENDRLPIGPKSVLVIDEAALLDAKTYDALVTVAERSGATLILTGDDGHLHYGAGGMFRQFATTLGCTTLSTAHRQRDPLDAAATEHLARGGTDAITAIRDYAERGKLIGAGKDADHFHDRIVADFTSDPSQDKVILTYKRADVDKLNTLARAAEQAFRDPALSEQFCVDADGNGLLLQAGDRVRVAASSYAHGLYKGDAAEVVHVNVEAQNYTLQLGHGDEARYMTLPVEGGPALSYAYAQTIDAAAGQSHQSVHVALTPSMAFDRTYLALSRHKDSLRIYAPTSQDEAVPFATTLVSCSTTHVSTLERDYGFDPHRASEAVQFARADQSRLADYLDSRDAPSGRPTRARLLDIFKMGGDREGLAPAAAPRALAHVLDGRAFEGDMSIDGATRHQVFTLLRSVSDETTWKGLSRSFSRAERTAIDANARRWTNTPSSDELIPDARALSRALAYSDKIGKADVSRLLQSGMDMLAQRVQVVRDTGNYEALLKEANAPVEDPAYLAPKADKIIAEQQRSDKAYATRSYKTPMPSLRTLASGDEVAIARLVLREISPTTALSGFMKGLAGDNWQEKLFKVQEMGVTSGGVIPQEIAKALGERLRWEREQALLDQPSSPSSSKRTIRVNTLSQKETPMDMSMASKATPAHAGHLDYWEKHVTNQYDRPEPWHIVSEEGYEKAKLDVPDWVGPRAETLISRYGPVKPKDVEAYFAPAQGKVPNDWIERHKIRLQNVGHTTKAVPFKTVEEFQWAIEFSAERNTILGDEFPEMDKTFSGSDSDWVNDLRVRLFNQTPSSRGITLTEVDWISKQLQLASSHAQVDDYSYRDNAMNIMEDYGKVGLPELEKEVVPQAWKARLLHNVQHFNNVDNQARVESIPELQWNLKFLLRTGEMRKTNVEPKLVNGYKQQQEMGLDNSPSPGGM